jgi:hypothetical protein
MLTIASKSAAAWPLRTGNTKKHNLASFIQLPVFFRGVADPLFIKYDSVSVSIISQKEVLDRIRTLDPAPESEAENASL